MCLYVFSCLLLHFWARLGPPGHLLPFSCGCLPMALACPGIRSSHIALFWGGLFRGGFALCLLALTKLYIGSNTITAVGSTPCCSCAKLSGMSSAMPPTFLSSFTPSCCLKYVLHSASRSLLPTPPSSPSIDVAPVASVLFASLPC